MFFLSLVAAIASAQQGTPPELPDEKIGREAVVQIDKEVVATKNKDYQDRVDRIGAQLAEIANTTAVKVTYGDPVVHRFNYRFKVVVDPKRPDEVNAFALPGGAIYVYEGLLKFAQSDDEVAGVLAHEVAHASLRHGVTLMKQSSKMEWLNLVALLGVLYGGGNGAAAAMGVQLGGTALQSGWSQDAEEAADYAGFQYLLKTGYNPSGMVTFMERLGQRNRTEQIIDWGIYRTHPPSPKRAERLTNFLKAQGKEVERSKVTTSFRTTLVPKENSTFDLKFGDRLLATFAGEGAKSRGEVAANQLNRFFDHVPNVYEVRAVGNRILGMNRVILELNESDRPQNQTLEGYTATVLGSIKSAIFALSYSVWSGGSRG